MALNFKQINDELNSNSVKEFDNYLAMERAREADRSAEVAKQIQALKEWHDPANDDGGANSGNFVPLVHNQNRVDGYGDGVVKDRIKVIVGIVLIVALCIIAFALVGIYG
jgi:hypothetical protein